MDLPSPHLLPSGTEERRPRSCSGHFGAGRPRSSPIQIVIELCFVQERSSTILHGVRRSEWQTRYQRFRDIRATILAIAPHAAHEIDYDAAIARARANEPYASALQAFNSFRSRASDFAVRFALLNRRGVEADAILEEFTEDVKVFHCIDDPAECRRLADWLLEEGRRFHRGSDTRGTGTFEGAMAGAFGSDRLRRTSMPWRSLLDREWRTIFIRSRRCAGCGLPRGLRPALSTTLGRSSVARRSPIEVP